MGKVRNKFKAFWSSFKKEQQTEASKSMIQDLLEDMYADRGKIYKVNFFRGVFFGFGSVLGGTILIAFTVWVLAQLGAVVPFLSDFIQQILDALSSRGK